MIYSLQGGGDLRLVRVGANRIQVAIEAREIAARNFEAYPVITLEHPTSDSGVNVHLVWGVALHKNGGQQRHTVAQPGNAVGNE